MSEEQWEGLEDWEVEVMRREAQERADREAALAALAANRQRRERAEAEIEAAREELPRLLAAGQDLALEVAEMARVSGVSRDTAHRRLREVGSISMRERWRRRDREQWLKRQRQQPQRSLEENERLIRGGLRAPTDQRRPG